jgi:FkbM family methyltransferase
MFTQTLAKLKHRWLLMNFKPGMYERNLYGISLKVFTNSLFSDVLFGPKRTDWKEIRFIQENLISNGDTVCDVGANIGFTTMFMSKCATGVKAYGVEPNPINLEAFYKNIELNELENTVFVIPAAASTISGDKIRLTVHPNSALASANEKQQTYVAETVSLDEYFSAPDKQLPNFLKVDVEGAELLVLQGAKKILANCPKLAIEIHVVNFSDPLQTIHELFALIDLSRYRSFIQLEVDGAIIPFNASLHSAEALSKLVNVHLFCIPK